MEPLKYPKEPEEPTTQSKGFTYDKRGLRAYGYVRETTQEIRELLIPATFRLKRDQKAAAQRAEQKCRLPWFKAQLRHYGIPSGSKHTVQVLKTKLSNAVREGMVCISILPLSTWPQY